MLYKDRLKAWEMYKVNPTTFYASETQGFSQRKRLQRQLWKAVFLVTVFFFFALFAKKKISLESSNLTAIFKAVFIKILTGFYEAQITSMNQVNKQNSELFYEVSLTLVNALSWYPMLALLKELSLCHKLKSPNLFSN